MKRKQRTRETENTSSCSVRPFLRWAGSKRSILPQLHEMFDADSNRYIEPFVGCGALYFKLRPKKAQLSDINPYLIDTFKHVKRDPDGVYDLLCQIPRTKKEYLSRRAQPFSSRSGNELAANFIFINRNCFNGLYRINKSGLFNVPFSSSRTGNYPALQEFRSISKVLTKTRLKCGDFFSIVANSVQRGDFVYLDPPYAVRDRRVFHEYSYDYFKVEDISRLRELLGIIDDAGAKFMLSYADNPIIRPILKDWHFKKISINRNIAGFLSARRRDSEVLITNFERS